MTANDRERGTLQQRRPEVRVIRHLGLMPRNAGETGTLERGLYPPGRPEERLEVERRVA